MHPVVHRSSDPAIVEVVEPVHDCRVLFPRARDQRRTVALSGVRRAGCRTEMS